MPPLDTARRLIRALSLPTRLANPGTNSESDGAGDEFIDVELQDFSDWNCNSSNSSATSQTSTPDTSRPASPITAINTGLDHHRDQLTGLPTALRYRSRAITRSTRYSFDSASSPRSRGSSRGSTRSSSSTISSASSRCDEVAVRKKRPAIKRRESESCWKEYWD